MRSSVTNFFERKPQTKQDRWWVNVEKKYMYNLYHIIHFKGCIHANSGSTLYKWTNSVLPPSFVFLLHWEHPSSPAHYPSLPHGPKFVPVEHYQGNPLGPVWVEYTARNGYYFCLFKLNMLFKPLKYWLAFPNPIWNALAFLVFMCVWIDDLVP